MSEFEPLLGYEYNTQGYHGSGTLLRTEKELDLYMEKVVSVAFNERREVMLTDMGDNAVFHCKEGRVIFAGGWDCHRMERALQQVVRNRTPSWER